MYVCAPYVYACCPRSLEEGDRSPGTSVPMWVLGIEPKFPGRTATALNH